MRMIYRKMSSIFSKNRSSLFLLLSFFFQSAFALITPIYVLYLQSEGLTPQQITTVSSVFMISLFLLEVPTGLIADVFGRKFSVVIGWALRSVSFFVYYWADSLPVFFIAEFVGAIGAACVSGSFAAWLREKIDYQGYLKTVSQTEVVIRIAPIFLSLISGYLAFNFGYNNLFLIGGVILMFTTFFGIFFHGS